MPVVRLSPAFVRVAACPPGLKKVDYFDAHTRGFLLEVRRSGGKTYYQRYVDDRGRERQFKVGPADVLTLRQARALARHIKAEAILGGDPQQMRIMRRAIPTLRKFADERYLPYVKGYKRSWKTDETILRLHILPTLGRYFLDELTPHQIVELTKEMRDKGYSPGTVSRVIVILRYIFNLANKWKVMPTASNPASGIHTPPDVQRSRYLNKEEAERLLASIRIDENEIAASAILLLLLTGARRSEITQARWSDIDWQQQLLLVRKAKSGHSRYIQLNSSARQLLETLQARSAPENAYVFPSATTRMPMASLYFPWDRIRKRAALADLRLHDLRHSFASFLINDGWDLYDIQKLLGHSNPRTTQRYAHLSRERLAKAAEAITSIINSKHS